MGYMLACLFIFVYWLITGDLKPGEQLILILAWAVSGIFGVGARMAYTAGEHKLMGAPDLASIYYRRDLGEELSAALLGGPVYLIIVTFVLTAFWRYGWTLLPPKNMKG